MTGQVNPFGSGSVLFYVGVRDLDYLSFWESEDGRFEVGRMRRDPMREPEN